MKELTINLPSLEIKKEQHMEKDIVRKESKAETGTILIVDDSSFMRSSLKVIAERGGYEVVGMTGDGEDALAQHKRLRPDLVTLDILMEPMDGLTVLESIKECDPEAKVVMVTAIGQEEMQERAKRLGSSGYIRKPFNPQEVLREIGKVLDAGKTGAQDETME